MIYSVTAGIQTNLIVKENEKGHIILSKCFSEVFHSFGGIT